MTGTRARPSRSRLLTVTAGVRQTLKSLTRTALVRTAGIPAAQSTVTAFPAIGPHWQLEALSPWHDHDSPADDWHHCHHDDASRRDGPARRRDGPARTGGSGHCDGPGGVRLGATVELSPTSDTAARPAGRLGHRALEDKLKGTRSVPNTGIFYYQSYE